MNWFQVRHPITAFLWRMARTVRELRRELAEREQVIAGQAQLLDTLRHELAVQRTRTRRWQRTAQEMAPALGERAMRAVDFQSASDEIADLPEREEPCDGLA